MLILNVNNNLASQFPFKIYLLALFFIQLYPMVHFMSIYKLFLGFLVSSFTLRFLKDFKSLISF